MAQYKPSFVDITGMSTGIAQGLAQAAQIKQQTESLVDSQLENFRKNFDPKKLRAQDLPDFTNAFETYKQSALKYSRLNRGGAKPAEIAVANEIKDRALNNMNELYSKSSMANQFLAERDKYRATMTQRGFQVPEEVNEQILQLSTSPAKDIDFKALKSPYDIDVNPNAKDLSEVAKQFKGLNRSIEEDIDEEEEFDVNGQKVKVTVKGKYKRANAMDAINIAEAQMLNSRINKSTMDEYNDIMQGFNLPDDITDPQLLIIKKKSDDVLSDIVKNAKLSGFDIQSIEDITPAMYLANKYGALRPQRVGRILDDVALKNAWKNAGMQMQYNKFAETIKQNQFRNQNTLFNQGISERRMTIAETKSKKGDLSDFIKAKMSNKGK